MLSLIGFAVILATLETGEVLQPVTANDSTIPTAEAILPDKIWLDAFRCMERRPRHGATTNKTGPLCALGATFDYNAKLAGLMQPIHTVAPTGAVTGTAEQTNTSTNKPYRTH